jgi:hypothetical protein
MFVLEIVGDNLSYLIKTLGNLAPQRQATLRNYGCFPHGNVLSANSLTQFCLLGRLWATHPKRPKKVSVVKTELFYASRWSVLANLPNFDPIYLGIPEKSNQPGTFI